MIIRDHIQYYSDYRDITGYLFLYSGFLTGRYYAGILIPGLFEQERSVSAIWLGSCCAKNFVGEAHAGIRLDQLFLLFSPHQFSHRHTNNDSTLPVPYNHYSRYRHFQHGDLGLIQRTHIILIIIPPNIRILETAFLRTEDISMCCIT